MPKYAVVAMSRASAAFYPGESFAINYPLPDGSILLLSYVSLYEGGFEAPLPVALQVQAFGEAPDILAAENQFTQAARQVAAVMAFVTNAHFGHLEIELAVGCDPECAEQEFMQRLVVMPPLLFAPGRRIDPDLLKSFCELLSGHPEHETVQHAIAQYIEALGRWNAGYELLCIEHLFMGCEALGRLLGEAELKRTGLGPAGLAKLWGVYEETPEGHQKVGALNNEVMRRFIFQGDAVGFKEVKYVSDAFEHGFRRFNELHQPARERVIDAAKYLREAIVRFVDPTLTTGKMLTDPVWVEPRGPIKLSKKVRGKLHGKLDELAAPGQPYPLFDWTSTLKTVRLDERGVISFLPEEKMTARFGEGVKFNGGTFEVWDDNIRKVSSFAPPVPSKVEVTVTGPEQSVARQTPMPRSIWKRFKTFGTGLSVLVREFFARDGQ